MNRKAFIIGAGVVGSALAVFLGRKSVYLAFDAAKDAAFTALLPSSARVYAPDIIRISRSKGISPAVTYALGQRESQWGVALTPPGAAGTGDFTPRTWTPTPMPSGQSAVSPDGKQRGWGFGLMQLDYHHYKSWLDTHAWWQPAVIIAKALDELKLHIDFFASKKPLLRNGVQITDGKYVYFSDSGSRARWGTGAVSAIKDPRPLKGDVLMSAAIAAYNGGDAFVLRSVAAGKHPDFTTTGGEYSQSVLAQAGTLLSKLA